VPTLYCMAVVTPVIDEVTPSNLTAAAVGAAWRLGSVKSVGSDAAVLPVTALRRIIRVISDAAVAEGNRADTFSGSAVIAVHLAPPFVLYSIRFETPDTVSAGMLRVRPVGDAAGTEGMVIVAINEARADAVALVCTWTVAAEPNTLRGIVVPVQDAHVVPPSRLNCMAAETPVIVSVVPLYTALGAAGIAGAFTLSAADAGKVVVAATRI